MADEEDKPLNPRPHVAKIALENAYKRGLDDASRRPRFRSPVTDREAQQLTGLVGFMPQSPSDQDWLPTVPQVEVNGPFGPENADDKESWLVRSVSDTGHSVEFYDKREAVAFARDVNVMLKEMFPGTRADERLSGSYVLRDRTEKGPIAYKGHTTEGQDMPDEVVTSGAGSRGWTGDASGTTNADDSKPMTPREQAVKNSLKAAWERGARSVQFPITDQEARDALSWFMRAEHNDWIDDVRGASLGVDAEFMTPREQVIRTQLREAYTAGARSRSTGAAPAAKVFTDQVARVSTTKIMGVPHNAPEERIPRRHAWIITAEKGDIAETTVYWNGVRWIEDSVFALHFMDMTAAVLFAQQLRTSIPSGITTIQATPTTV